MAAGTSAASTSEPMPRTAATARPQRGSVYEPASQNPAITDATRMASQPTSPNRRGYGLTTSSSTSTTTSAAASHSAPASLRSGFTIEPHATATSVPGKTISTASITGAASR